CRESGFALLGGGAYANLGQLRLRPGPLSSQHADVVLPLFSARELAGFVDERGEGRPQSGGRLVVLDQSVGKRTSSARSADHGQHIGHSAIRQRGVCSVVRRTLAFSPGMTHADQATSAAVTAPTV